MYKNYTEKQGVVFSNIYKILFIMRVIALLFFAAIMQVSASTNAQKLTYVQKNASLEQLFKEIKKQTGYNIVWYEGKLNPEWSVNANFRKTPLKDVMDIALTGMQLDYTISNKTVVIKEKELSLMDKLNAAFSNIVVHGRVVDETGAGLQGASVKVKNTNKVTITDVDGHFTLNGVPEKATLVISYLGYETKEVEASEKIGAIQLFSGAGKLEEVQINAGYYTVTDRERTGSISKITSKDIEKQPVNNVLAAMQANIPGVQITQNTGLPGGGFTVQVRGQNSLQQGNDPFYIIDGVPFTSTGIAGTRDNAFSTNGANPLASINPQDIESIEILKDADATAIYGSRGANGVVLISTKRGKIGKTAGTFTLNQGISRVGKKLKLMNTPQYLEMRKEALTNDKLTSSTNDYDLNGTWSDDRDIDWQKELIGGIAPTTNVQSSLSGGTQNFTYLVSGNFYREGTVFPGKHSYTRGSGNFSLQYISDNKKLSAFFDANYSQINSNLFTTDLTQFIILPPNYPTLLNERGELNWANNTMYVNPIAETQRPYDAKTNNLISNAVINYNIIPDLKLKSSFGYTQMDRKELSTFPLTTYSPALNYGSERRYSYFANNSTNSWILESQVDWNKQIGGGKLNLLVGTTFQQNLTDGQELRGAGYTSDALMENIAAASVLTVQNRYYLQYRYTAVFGRVNYILKDKYIINATGRRDGSSRFGLDNRFANFGAVGVAWIISGEDLIKEKISFLSFAKLRGSYGITGNDRIGDYGYLNLWNSVYGTYQGVTTMAPIQIANPNYAWEVNKKLEFALETGFFKDKINFSVDYYANKSSNQLVQKQLTPSTGFGFINDNLPAKISNSGWEFELRTKNFDNKIFKWATSINLTIPKNKLIDYPDLASSSFATTYEIGQPLSIKKLYNSYLDSQTGLYTREDFDKNGIIDNKDQYVIAFIGRNYYGGVQNSLSYSGVSFDFLVQFVKQSGKGAFSGFNMPGRFSRTSPLSNQLAEVSDRWQGTDDIYSFQKYSTLSSVNTIYTTVKTFGALAVDNTSYIRLKNVSVSYDLQKNISKKIKINGLRVFLQGQNLITFTKYKGLDPETQSLTNLPPLQVFTIGVQLTL